VGDGVERRGIVDMSSFAIAELQKIDVVPMSDNVVEDGFLEKSDVATLELQGDDDTLYVTMEEK